jgi:hypothetical protein
MRTKNKVALALRSESSTSVLARSVRDAEYRSLTERSRFTQYCSGRAGELLPRRLPARPDRWLGAGIQHWLPDRAVGETEGSRR